LINYFIYNIKSTSKYIISLILLYLFTIFYYINYNIVDSSDIKRSTLNNIITYIKNNTSKEDIIFTANPTFIFRSDRNLALNITHPLVYIKNPPYFSDYDPYKLVPSINYIINYLDSHNIKYIIADRRTKALFISNRHENIENYIKNNYILDYKIDDIEILKKVN
jgi:hypothetical protein